MKWFQPILPLLLALALPCEAADPLPPAEIAELRAQRKTLGQEALLKIGEKKYRGAIPLLEECNRIQEKIGEINTANTAVHLLYLGSGRELARFGEAPEIKTNPAVVLGDAAYGSPKPPLKPDRPLAIRCAPRPARAAPKRRSLQSLLLGCLYPHRPMALIFKK